jgi:hypothetical protein
MACFATNCHANYLVLAMVRWCAGGNCDTSHIIDGRTAVSLMIWQSGSAPGSATVWRVAPIMQFTIRVI